MTRPDLDNTCEALFLQAANSLADATGMGVLCNLLAILFHETDLPECFPDIAAKVPRPTEIRKTGSLEEMLKNQNLNRAFVRLSKRLGQNLGPATARGFLTALLIREDGGVAEEGRSGFLELGLEEEEIVRIYRELDIRNNWRQSATRQSLRKQHHKPGYVEWKTWSEPKVLGAVGMDRTINQLCDKLLRPRYRAVALVGDRGSGKSGHIKELARRLHHMESSLEQPIRDHDIVKILPGGFRPDTIDALGETGKIIFYLDGFPEAFAQIACKGLPCIFNCTPAQFQLALKNHSEMAGRVEKIQISVPDGEQTMAILRGRRSRCQPFDNAALPAEILAKVVDLTERGLPDLSQPAKSIRLLEAVQDYCLKTHGGKPDISVEDIETVFRRDHPDATLLASPPTYRKVLTRLKERIVGQDDILEELAKAVAGGFGSFREPDKPRGVFMFAGSTGVGKTETARCLEEILGGQRKTMIRVDCNLLAGRDSDIEEIKNRLIGGGPSYKNYEVGGMLGKVHERGDCVLLFDEIEKSGPNMRELLLQIMDDGHVMTDAQTVLDFSRTFIIFTTNAGAVAGGGAIGFEAKYRPPAITKESVVAAFRESGEEPFQGRIRTWLIFRNLDEHSARQLVNLRLEALRKKLGRLGLELKWAEEAVDWLLSRWDSDYGARNVEILLQNAVMDNLNLAEREEEFRPGITVRIDPAGSPQPEKQHGPHFAFVDGELVITLS